MYKNGYLYIYVSSETNVDVFFDNLQVTHVRGGLLEESHYYPFGLTMAGISSKALAFGGPENKYRFNGIEQNDAFDMNMYDAFYRNLHPQIGKFWQIDPVTTYSESPYVAMQDNPIVKKDWLGNYFTWANGAEERYNSLRKQNSQLLAGYVGELSNLDLSPNDPKVQKQISRLQTLINMHGDLNKQWNEMEESDVEFHVSLEGVSSKAGEGETTYNRSKNRIDISLFGKRGNSNNVMAHELRHGYGYLNGEAVGGDHDPLYDLTDENVGRNAGYLFLDRSTANLVADGFFTTEKFAEHSTTVPGSTYHTIRKNKISLTLNTPAAVLMNYIGGSYLKGYIQRNLSNINLTARDALDAVNSLDKKANRPLTYVFGDALKNR